MGRQRRSRAGRHREGEARSRNGVANGDIYGGFMASCFRGQFSLWVWKMSLTSLRASQGLELGLSAPPP